MSAQLWALDLRVSLGLAKSFGQRLSAALPLQGQLYSAWLSYGPADRFRRPSEELKNCFTPYLEL